MTKDSRLDGHWHISCIYIVYSRLHQLDLDATIHFRSLDSDLCRILTPYWRPQLGGQVAISNCSFPIFECSVCVTKHFPWRFFNPTLGASWLRADWVCIFSRLYQPIWIKKCPGCHQVDMCMRKRREEKWGISMPFHTKYRCHCRLAICWIPYVMCLLCSTRFYLQYKHIWSPPTIASKFWKTFLLLPPTFIFHFNSSLLRLISRSLIGDHGTD